MTSTGPAVGYDHDVVTFADHADRGPGIAAHGLADFLVIGNSNLAVLDQAGTEGIDLGCAVIGKFLGGHIGFLYDIHGAVLVDDQILLIGIIRCSRPVEIAVPHDVAGAAEAVEIAVDGEDGVAGLGDGRGRRCDIPSEGIIGKAGQEDGGVIGLDIGNVDLRVIYGLFGDGDGQTVTGVGVFRDGGIGAGARARRIRG